MNSTTKETHKISNKSGLSSLDYRIIEFIPQSATDEEWEKFFAIREKLHYEHTPDDPFGDRLVLRKKMSFDNPYEKVWRSLIILNNDSSTVLGYLIIYVTTEASPEYEDNKHIAWAYVIVDKAYRRNGIGTDLVRRLIPKLREFKSSTIQVWNEYDSGKAFSKDLGGSIALRNYENRVQFNEIDWAKMNEWVKDGKRRSPGVEIKTFEDVPEEIIEEYVRVFTETANQAPYGDLDGQEIVTPESRRQQEAMQRDAGTIWITKISVETDGKISGQTEIHYNPKDSHAVYQELTGVKQEYRGRRLGKMLKADMALLIKDKYPNIDYIGTGNAMSNEPMLRINRGMGFKEVKRFETYKFKIDELETRVSDN
ncbi:MAG: GNAT family N-acetyltransferase [Candidatus Heimdallarchaeota archaeon]|nr:GNAT family N-acetyltransferase [Candidatus Heimdallarchaeota archaeon]